MFSQKICHVAIHIGSILWISIRYDAIQNLQKSTKFISFMFYVKSKSIL